MRILKYKVRNFKSIEDTNWIEIDEKCTCFIGLNESGKSNLLQAIYFLVAPPEQRELLSTGLPVKFHTKGLPKEPFIEVLYKLEEKDKVWKQLYKNSKEQSLLIKRNFHGNCFIHLANDQGEEQSDNLRSLVKEEVWKKITDQLPRFYSIAQYENFYFRHNLLEVQRHLEHYRNRQAGNRIPYEQQQALLLNRLFDYLDLDLDEVISPVKEKPTASHTPNYFERWQIEQKKLDEAAEKLSQEFSKFYPQEEKEKYTFGFRIAGQRFSIYVSDNQDPPTIPLQARSDGFQWLFNLFIELSVAQKKVQNKNVTLLLDEPGLHLHPSAQTELVGAFKAISEKHQLIYTTHSPYLLDHERLDRVRAVYKEGGVTKVSNNLTKAAKKDIKIMAAVKTTLQNSALNDLSFGYDIVIVEGVTDRIYLMMIQHYLITKHRFTPKKHLLFMSADGADKVADLVPIAVAKDKAGNNNQEQRKQVGQVNQKKEWPMVLLDSDESGQRIQAKLTGNNGLYQDNQNKVLAMDCFTGKTGSEIEDLIPPELIVESFNSLPYTEKTVKVENIKPNEPIMPQLEKYAPQNEGNEWKKELSEQVTKDIQESGVTSGFEEKWMELFKSLEESKD